MRVSYQQLNLPRFWPRSLSKTSSVFNCIKQGKSLKKMCIFKIMVVGIEHLINIQANP